METARLSFAPGAMPGSISASVNDILAFEDMRHELSAFTSRFDLWVAHKQDALLEDKTKHKKKMMEENGSFNLINDDWMN